jgi:sodium/potassium-transporting ATPase subunit alpha
MFVTDCSLSRFPFLPESARDEMVVKGKASGVHQLRALAGLCNASEFDAATINLPLHERVIHGDATDQAVFRFSEGLGPTADLRRMWKRIYELPFNSKNKFMIRTFTPDGPNGLGLAMSPAEVSQFRSDDTYVLVHWLHVTHRLTGSIVFSLLRVPQIS